MDNEYKTAVEVTRQIMEINNQLRKESFLKNMNGDVLTYTAVKLAALKAYLIEVKFDLHKQMLELEIESDKQKAIAYKIALKETNATAAKDGKYDDEVFIKARWAYAKAKADYERMKSITADTHDIIDSIKSRVIDLQGARKDERVG